MKVTGFGILGTLGVPGKRHLPLRVRSDPRRVVFFSSKYKAHRVIWLLVVGYWPKDEIDHINQIRDDNRWVNLREVTRTENAKNLARRRDNKSGVTGVFWNPINENWRVAVSSKCFGSFKTKEEAIKVRKAAEIKYGFHPNHGKKLS